MYTIGEFAERSGLTPKALRLYEERGLLVPARDPLNGYRYYAEDDLEAAGRIIMLKELGFSLAEIGQVTRFTRGPRGATALESAVARRLRQCRNNLAELSARERTLRHLLLVLRGPSRVSLTELQHLVLSAKERADMLQALQAEHRQLTITNARPTNDDSTLVAEHVDGNLYIVADGMGPKHEGSRASALACETIAEQLDRSLLEPGAYESHFAELINRAGRRILEECEAVGDQRPGTTLTFVVVKRGTAYIGHVGDTRVYRFHRELGQLNQLTTDHTRIQQLLDDGEILERDIQGHPEQHMLYAAVGFSEQIPEVFTTMVDLTPDDALLLTSDGITSVLSDREILGVLTEHADLDEAARQLIDLAERHGEDNASVVTVSWR